jgi:FkbM family methyltransferase
LDDYRLRLHPASLSVNLFVDSELRFVDEQIVRALVPRGGTYVDVGANIGQLVIAAHRAAGASSSITAIEPHPRTASFLRENLRLNGIEDVRVMQAAAGDRFGWTSFTDYRDDDQNSVVEKGSASEHILVPIVRLDAFLAGQSIDLVKIDVEGYEKYVLDGLDSALDRVSHIYFEVSDEHYSSAGYRFSDLYDLLDSRGYWLGKVRSGILVEVGAGDRFPHVCNILASRDTSMLQQNLLRAGLIR